MLGAIINLLYPAICRVCSKKINRLNQNICNGCINKIKERLPPFCIKCGKQLNGHPELTAECCDCKNENPYFDRAWSACYYEGVLKELIHDFKYKKITALSTDFTTLITDFMKKYNIARNCHLVIPVPMHPRRLFKREINHSDILAKNIAKELNIRYSNRILKKIKDTPVQSTLKRHERIKNLSSSFSFKNSSLVRGKNILIVDDLFTTGSTVNECARVLKDAGAESIEVITLARGDRV